MADSQQDARQQRRVLFATIPIDGLAHQVLGFGQLRAVREPRGNQLGRWHVVRNEVDRSNRLLAGRDLDVRIEAQQLCQPRGSVSVVTATPSTAPRTTTQPATVHAFYEARVFAKAAGYLTELNADIGANVKAGDVLAVMDVPEMASEREAKLAMIRRMEADQRRAESQVAVSKASMASYRAKPNKAKAEVGKAEAGLTAARVEFERVGDLVRNTQTGSSKDGPPLFVVTQLDKVRVRVAVPERDAPLATVGDAAEISLQALPDQVFQGSVSRVAGVLDEKTRTMRVEIDLPNLEERLRPGMHGQAKIVLDPPGDTLTLSANVVRYDEHGGSCVYVVNGSSEVEVVAVKTGLHAGHSYVCFFSIFTVRTWAPLLAQGLQQLFCQGKTTFGMQISSHSTFQQLFSSLPGSTVRSQQVLHCGHVEQRSWQTASQRSLAYMATVKEMIARLNSLMMGLLWFIDFSRLLEQCHFGARSACVIRFESVV